MVEISRQTLVAYGLIALYRILFEIARGSASVLAVHELSLFNLPRHMRAMSLFLDLFRYENS